MFYMMSVGYVCLPCTESFDHHLVKVPLSLSHTHHHIFPCIPGCIYTYIYIYIFVLWRFLSLPLPFIHTHTITKMPAYRYLAMCLSSPASLDNQLWIIIFVKSLSLPLPFIHKHKSYQHITILRCII